MSGYPTEEVEDFLMENIFSGKPRSPSEAAEAGVQEPGQEPQQPAPSVPPPPSPETVPVPEEQRREDEPETVRDEPAPPAEPFPETPEQPKVEPVPGEEEEPETLDEEHIVWAKKKYGEDPERWAKAARDQETYITRLANEKREAESLAAQWYEYAQQAERQQQQLGGAMPLSTQEEQWVENSLSNPLDFARQAAFNGNTQLYNGVIGRIAEENAMLAAQIGTQVQTELQQYAAYEAQQQQQAQPDLAQSLGTSFSRLGIDLQSEGPRMAEKIADLGEYNPYVQAIMHGDEGQRDLAVQAVYDLTRATHVNTRRASRDQNIARENELRRDAMVVQSGGVSSPNQPPKAPSFLTGMQEEWQRRGQWAGDEPVS